MCIYFPFHVYHAIYLLVNAMLAAKRVSHLIFPFSSFPDPLERLISVHLFNSYHPRGEWRQECENFVKKVFGPINPWTNSLLRFEPSSLFAFEFFWTHGRPNCRIIVVISAWRGMEWIVSRKHSQFLHSEYDSIVRLCPPGWKLNLIEAFRSSNARILVGSRDNENFSSFSFSLLSSSLYMYIYIMFIRSF